MYDNEYKKLPYQWVEVVNGQSSPMWSGGEYYTWAAEVSWLMGIPKEHPVGAGDWFRVSPIFQCPKAPMGSNEWVADCRVTYQPNPRLMPLPQEMDLDRATDPPKPYSRRALSSIKNPSEKILVWDASVSHDLGMAIWYTHYFEWFVIQWGHFFTEPAGNNLDHRLDEIMPAGNAGVSNNVENLKRDNHDYDSQTQWHKTGMRYRHMNDTNITVLFADGHAEAMPLGAVKIRHLAVNFQ